MLPEPLDAEDPTEDEVGPLVVALRRAVVVLLDVLKLYDIRLDSAAGVE